MPARDRPRTFAAGLASVAIVALAAAGSAGAAPVDPPQTLELEVVVNGHSIQKVGEFVLEDGRLLVRRAELTALGLRVPPGVAPVTDGLLAVASLPGVTARLDAASQTLYLTAADDALTPSQLGVAPAVPSAPLQSGLGATLNYDVSGAVTNGHPYGSGLFDLRVFSPLGVASTDLLTYAGSAGVPGLSQAIRLDSTYVYSDFDSQRRYWVGDFITGGLTWTRPVRLGGVQVTRDFTMRPDLITFPLPALAGSVAVPSTVDVLVNGSRVLSSEVQPAPSRCRSCR